jgi:hypothetical protein
LRGRRSAGSRPRQTDGRSNNEIGASNNETGAGLFNYGLGMGINFNTVGLIGTIGIGPRDVGDWRECAVALRAAGFSAEYTCSVRDEELRRFLSQLESAIAKLGQAVSFQFQVLERGFAFEIAMSRGGHVDGKYMLGRDWRGPFLSGSFTADQTHLRAWAGELRSALVT